MDKIDVGIAGTHKTALYEAIFMSSKLFKTSKSKNKIAILLTDGVDNTGTIPLDVAIKVAKKYKIKFYVIGIGTGRDFNKKVLQKIATETNGKFYSTTTKQELINIYKDIDKLEKSKIEINKYVDKTYYFQNLLFVILILLSLLFILKEWRK
jgi:Ca-activated chloride channel family protein